MWEFFMMIVFPLQFITIPLDVLTTQLDKMDNFQSGTSWLAFRFTLDLLTLIDCFLNFLTGYYDSSKREVVMDPKEVAT